MRKNQLKACIMSGLACGIFMGIWGIGAVPVQAAVYEEEMMVDINSDDLDSSSSSYIYRDVMGYDYQNKSVVYDFRGEGITEISGHAVQSINVCTDCRADVRANVLKLRSDVDGYGFAGGAMLNDKGKLDLNAKTILVSSNMSGGSTNYGIAMAHTASTNPYDPHDESYKGGRGILNVNGELIIKNDIDGDIGTLKESFIYDPDYGMTRENGYWGFYGPQPTNPDGKYKGGRWLSTGIFAGLSAGSVMNLNQPVYLAVKGTAIQSDPYYKWKGIHDYDLMTVNVKKGGYIITPVDKDTVSYALANFGGTININMKNGKPGAYPVYMVGNVIVMKDNGQGGEYFFRSGRTNVALTTPDSYWKGGIDNTGKAQTGQLNLWINNGAQWICEETGMLDGMKNDMMEPPSKGHYGTYDGVHHVHGLIGGSTHQSAGIITQKDSRPIEVEVYGGHMRVVYPYAQGDDTFSSKGNFIIRKANAHSEIMLMTSGNISHNMVKKSLFNKLKYYGQEGNLKTSVYVGEGMLRSARLYRSIPMEPEVYDIHEGERAVSSAMGGKEEVTPIDPSLALEEVKFPRPKEEDKYVRGYISGNPETDSPWIKEKAYKGNGVYEFTEDTWIMAEKDRPTVAEVTVEGDYVNEGGEGITGGQDGTAQIRVKKVHNVHIKAKDKKLYIATPEPDTKIINKAGNSKRLGSLTHGISNYFTMGGKLTIEAKEIHIFASSRNTRVEAIGLKSDNKKKKAEMTLNGDVYVNAYGTGGYLLGVYTAGNSNLVINGNLTMWGMDEKETFGVHVIGKDKPLPLPPWGQHYYKIGLYTGSDYTIQQGSCIEINGDVYMRVQANAVFSNGGGSRIDISGGGHIEVEHSRTAYYSLLAQCGVIHVNVNRDGTVPNNHKLVIKGDMALMDGSVHPNEPSKVSEIVVALTTPDSSLHGRIYIGFKKKADLSMYTNRNVLFLQNGATWYDIKRSLNANYTQVTKDSNVSELYGGKDEEHAGIIVRDKMCKLDENLNIGRLQGYIKVICPHLYNGMDKSDYGGRIVVEKADPGAFITAVTDTYGFNIHSKDQIFLVLQSLADHFVYKDAKNNPNNLKGKVVIAEGLLNSSKYLVSAEMKFDPRYRGAKVDKNRIQKVKDNGTGETPNPGAEPIPGEKPKPGTDPKTEITITDGDFETGVMEGIRSSIFSAVSMYRAHSNDVLKRLGDVRLAKADVGIWAKYQGGHTDIHAKDNKKLAIQLDQKYNMIQVGFDKKLNPSVLVGAAFDYGTTTDTYEFGTGKGNMGGLSLYGTMTKPDGIYVDVIGKFGKMKTDYDVQTKEKAIYKVIGEKASGSYEALAGSLSVEIGKRMEKSSGFYLEPNAEMTLGYVGENSHYVKSEKGGVMNVKQKSMMSAIGKLGFAIGKNMDGGSLYAKGSVAHEFSGKLDTVFSVGKESKTVTMELSDTWFELETGGTWKLSDSGYVYGSISKSFGALVNEKWRIDAGIRLAF